MADPAEKIKALEEQMTEISDIHANLVGLIEKASGIQLKMMESGLDAYIDRVAEAGSALSTAAEKLQATEHDMELERNQLRSES